MSANVKQHRNQRGTCSIEGCEWPHMGRGWCNRHYQRWYQYGDPLAGGPLTGEPPDGWRERIALKERERHLKKTYGITLDDYDEMLERQGGGCAICSGPQFDAYRYFDIDHDGTTGAVRGLLCRRCNTGLGYLEAGFHHVGLLYLEQHS